MSLRRSVISRSSQWKLLSAILIGLLLIVTSALVFERNRVASEQRDRLNAKAKMIEANMVQQLKGVNSALLSMLAAGTDERNLQTVSTPLGAMSGAIPGVRTLLVLDGAGRVLASNRSNLIGVSFSSRDYYRLVTTNPSENLLYLSAPFKTALGVYSMNLLRVSVNESGLVEKIASATLDPDFFRVLLDSVRYADDVWVAVNHIDGLQALQIPDNAAGQEVDLRAPNTLFRRHIDSDQSSTFFYGPATPTGQEMWMAQRTMSAPDLNLQGTLVFAVSRDPAKALEQWQLLVTLGTSLVLLLGCGSVLALRWVHKHDDILGLALAHQEKLRLKAEEKIKRLAFYDHLTQLPNRRLLLDQFSKLLATNVRHNRYSALLFLDLDNFKLVNDNHGHEEGDQLLVAIAARLEATMRHEDIAARWAGDEFIVILSELGSDVVEASLRAESVAEKVLASMSVVYDLGGLPYKCPVSIGITLFGDREESLEAIVKRSDEAMYEAKAAGRNTYRFKRAAAIEQA